MTTTMNTFKQAPLVIIATITMFAFSACKKERPQLGTAPTVSDATFTANPSGLTPISLTLRLAIQSYLPVGILVTD